MSQAPPIPAALLVIALSAALAAPVFAGGSPPVGGFTGNISLYAVVLDPDAPALTALDAVSLAPDAAHPLASSFKPVVLLEVAHAIDSETIGWKTRIDIAPSDHSLDFGRFPRRATVKKLAKKMIAKSHNTSTDVLFKTVGIDAPTARLDGYGLSAMRVVMPTREFWVALSGLVPALFPGGGLPAAAASYAGSTRSEQAAIVAQLRSDAAAVDVNTLELATDDFYDFVNYDQATSFAILDDIDNIATPRQLVEFYYRLFFDSGLSADSDERVRKLMSKGDGKIDRRQIDVPIRYWGGKGGSDLGMISVAGYGLTKRGNHILYAICGSHSSNEDADVDIVDGLITWVFDTLDAP